MKKPKFICPKCHLEIKTSREKHVNYCDGSGPRRLKKRRPGGQQWLKGKTFKELFGDEKASIIGQKISNSLVGKSSGIGSTPQKEYQRREKIRNAINKRYTEGWEVKCGRCTKIDYESSIAGKIKIDGSWELIFAQYLDCLGLNWQRNKKRFDYLNLQNKKSTYCPDFYLPDFDMYIEVKGYETDLDRCKWSQFKNKLLILKKQEIVLINKILGVVGERSKPPAC